MRTQSKTLSIIESVANTLIGLGTSFGIQLFIFPYFGIIISHTTNAKITLLFFVVSFIRSYLIRRFFNQIKK